MARGQTNDARADFIWKTPAPPRVQLFICLLLQRRIQCRSILFKKHIVDNLSCEICQTAEESPEHIMWGCDLGKQVWSKLGIVFLQDSDVSALYSISPPTGVPLDLFPTFIVLVCWQIWKARNAKIFSNETQTLAQVLTLCKLAAL
jgi:hypothetical protein